MKLFAVILALVSWSLGPYVIGKGIHLIRNPNDAKLVKLRAHLEEKGRDPHIIQTICFFYIFKYFMHGVLVIFCGVAMLALAFNL